MCTFENAIGPSPGAIAAFGGLETGQIVHAALIKCSASQNALGQSLPLRPQVTCYCERPRPPHMQVASSEPFRVPGARPWLTCLPRTSVISELPRNCVGRTPRQVSISIFRRITFQSARFSSSAKASKTWRLHPVCRLRLFAKPRYVRSQKM
jgi:hypothetical protein